MATGLCSLGPSRSAGVYGHGGQRRQALSPPSPFPKPPRDIPAPGHLCALQPAAAAGDARARMQPTVTHGCPLTVPHTVPLPALPTQTAGQSRQTQAREASSQVTLSSRSTTHAISRTGQGTKAWNQERGRSSWRAGGFQKLSHRG